MKIICSKSNPPLGGLFTAAYIKTLQNNITVDVQWGEESAVHNDKRSVICDSSNDVLRAIARLFDEGRLYGKSALEKSEVDSWLTFSIGPLSSKSDFNNGIQHLNKILAPSTYLVGKQFTIADFAVFSALYANQQWQALITKKEVPVHLQRWYNYISSQDYVQCALSSLPDEAKTILNPPPASSQSLEKSQVGSRQQEGKFVELPGAEMGKVVVRFPPEASGYLHIGHAKAALLNQYYQQTFQGKLIMRFDDTNPAKEDVHFEKVILEDVAMLEIKPDMFTHTSQYFDQMIEFCEKLLHEGKAYVDDTEPEQMKQEREQRIESKNRNNSNEKNFSLWKEMKEGTEIGQRCCVRAKIDMQSANGCLRDPTIYRCKNEPHPRTGTKYKVYPTYDFACPIVDAIEGVTHTLRTMEYHDRDVQFYWFIEALGLRRPYIWEYSRLSMTNTVLSKRKLAWFVEQGLVDSWDDPRFPTVRGVLRRGMTVEGLKQFIIAQGSSRSVVFMEWDKIWSINKKVIDPIAPRYTAVDFTSHIPVYIENAKEEKLTVPKHPKNAEVGDKELWIGPKILIDTVDAETLKEGENATFINWGNLLVKKINRENGKITSVNAQPNVENKDYKKTVKLTWLADTEKAGFTPTYCVYFDHIISKPLLGKDEDFKQYIGHQTRVEYQMLGDPELKKLKKGDIIQLQRRGYFIVDVPYEPINLNTCREQAIILFNIPDGHKNDNLMATPQIKPIEKKEASPAKVPVSTGSKTANQINAEIIKQGDVLRNLKAQKAEKNEIDGAVKLLLALKAEFKAITNSEWKPGCVPQDGVETAKVGPIKIATTESKSVSQINAEIVKQGDAVRNLKAQKAEKNEIDGAVKLLLALKAEFKAITNSEWKPGCVPQDGVETAKVGPIKIATTESKSASQINAEIVKQGDIVRNLKAQKAEKNEIDGAVKLLLASKAEFKAITDSEWKPGCVPQDGVETAKVGPIKIATTESKSASQINAEIVKQGDIVRNLKAQKADKSEIDNAVKVLLSLKAEYKTAANTEWKPGCVPPGSKQTSRIPTITPSLKQETKPATELNEEIIKQGDIVRNLKSKKAEKSEIDSAVKVLLGLKRDYKAVTDTEWKPGCIPPAAPSKPVEAPTKPLSTESNVSDLNNKIIAQADKVRLLKSESADKITINTEVQILLAFKAEYKKLTGKNWMPENIPAVIKRSTSKKTQSQQPSPTIKSNLNESAILQKITEQGDKVRDLKSKKADKAAVEAEVKLLLSLKADYKNITGKEWQPMIVATPIQEIEAPLSSSMTNANEIDELVAKINDQGNIVRNLKANKAPKDDIDAAVRLLLNLKAEYKSITGTDFPVPGKGNNKQAKEAKPKQVKESAAKSKSAAKEIKPVDAAEESGTKKQTRLGLEAKKEENLSDWYSQVITKGELIEYYDVSGCYILRPWSYAIWEIIQNWFDSEIKKLGVQNCYFPIFVSRAALEKEKSHIADFSPEVAWVTKSGDSDMAEPIAIRPTSETVMYPAYAKWIQSYRDLPIKLNQWNNVVRWEFKHPQPFLRTREFLWQEGHTAYAIEEDAKAEVTQILDLYAKIYTDLLAIPVIKGRKTEKEKFAGGNYTYTVEAFVSASGRAIQGATSHHLGQNFSKIFDIIYEDPDTKEKKYIYQNSWGFTTRSIGVMIMVHADNQGLILPPRVATIQVVIVPCGVSINLTDADRTKLQNSCSELEKELCAAEVKVKGDYRDNYSPGWKFNHWELKGVPIRVELGPKDIKNQQLVAVRRDTGEKITIKRANAIVELKKLLDDIQSNLYAKASKELESHTILTTDWSQFSPNLDKKRIILVPFCGNSSCEDNIKQDSTRENAEDPSAPSMGAKSLCIPNDQPLPIKDTDRCIHPACKNKPLNYTLFGRSY